MANIGEDFPKTRNARQEKLAMIKKGKSISTVKVPGHGVQNVYKIPLEYLSYNPYNTRFLAQAKTLETRMGRELSDECPGDLQEIEKFIWEYKKDKNDNTISSLIKEGQLQPGVVTPSGVILSGNRRFRLLNEIQRNYKKYAKKEVNLHDIQYFEAAVLDTELSNKEIRKYESFYQYGNEDKVEYDPIQKYLAANEQEKLGYSKKEIADNFLTLTDGNETKVTEWLAEFELMDEYLGYIGEAGIYTALEGREEAFINLYKTMKSFKQGSAGKEIWAIDEMDLENLKFRYFDFIWLNKATHEFRYFKRIFSYEKSWKDFNKKVKECVNSTPIQSLDEYREEHTNETESQISQIRENDYKNLFGNELNDFFDEEKRNADDREIEETPLKLIGQIETKITKLEEAIKNGSKDASENEKLLRGIEGLISKIGQVKQRLD
ncbi:MAG TPA: hypothetical protein DHW61_11345 [Lachnoclostridium phytofermentans]|uniref:ParB/Sulfiredoxin domain-containing protein n=1 Tax=Lachnoclostridium phytofermentans TaxID=66219 RepID=A0A3D2X7V8_9FIRM|nr:hypothetical protein [Lachnoclostridium sp.]HCL02984.1 hypothetical protein [Lachnoclostridium phytofermentans]